MLIDSQEKRLLSGNEAIARGAFEYGVKVATGYPGTPSTEILENIVQYPDIYCEWSVNEKIALEVAIGAALTGVRALVAMKHVGLNVASDPLMTLSYTGLKGGLVIVSADDPGIYSSQNEQDNRFYAKFAKIPLFEPSDSEEAKEFLGLAFSVSEEYDTPVILRITTRIAHTKCVVALKTPAEKHYSPGFDKNPSKYVMVPAHAKQRRIWVEERWQKLISLSENISCNRIEWQDRRWGIVTGGISFQYSREVFPQASFLKLGMTWPLPSRLIYKFAEGVEKLVVVEELEPFLEDSIRSLGISVSGKEFFPSVDELTPDKVAYGLKRFIGEREEEKEEKWEVKLPPRPPVMCPGCPHRGIFYVLRKLKAIVLGDIGCYTLGALPPLEAMDTCICMGASIGTAQGVEKALDGFSSSPIFAVIGDSTFVHSGITGLINAFYNGRKIKLIIMNNSTTAMTGRQDHPGTGLTLRREKIYQLNFVKLLEGIGVEHVRVIDPYNLKLVEQTLKEEINYPCPSVILTNRPCILISPRQLMNPLRIIPEICSGCGKCLQLGCPALIPDKKKVISSSRPKLRGKIISQLCTGCGLCRQICPKGAIQNENRAG